MKILQSVGALALSLSIALPLQADDKKHDHESHAGHMLEGYLEISDALFNDNLKAAKKAATKMVEHDDESSTASAAEAISKSKTLGEARDHFKHLTHAAMNLAKQKGGYHIMVCPMVKDGEWLQKDTAVKNPYMGQKMPGCGMVKKP